MRSLNEAARAHCTPWPAMVRAPQRRPPLGVCEVGRNRRALIASAARYHFVLIWVALSPFETVPGGPRFPGWYRGIGRPCRARSQRREIIGNLAPMLALGRRP